MGLLLQLVEEWELGPREDELLYDRELLKEWEELEWEEWELWLCPLGGISIHLLNNCYE
ncbi:MAG: hypothetical protein IJT62_01745 [Oscillospiraceae bacterium]|nr:hypothetical protein [Oscillospiraceae bacterium]